MNKLTLLGTGTCQIQKSKMAPSVLIEIDGEKILYDMGRGITQRLLDLQIKQDEIEHIIISHFHTDHFSDLPSYIHAGLWSKTDPRTKDLNIYGSPEIESFVENIIIDGMVSSFRLVVNFKIVAKGIQGNTFQINDQKFEVQILQPANNHAIKFKSDGKRIGITGDFDFSQDAIDFLKDLDIAIIDAGHNSPDQIVELAVKSQAKKIYCTHLYYELDEKKLNHDAKAKGYEGEIIVGEDLMEIEI